MGKQITFTFYFFTPSNSVFRDVSGHSGVPGCSGVPWCSVGFRGVPVFRGVPRCSGVPVFLGVPLFLVLVLERFGALSSYRPGWQTICVKKFCLLRMFRHPCCTKYTRRHVLERLQNYLWRKAGPRTSRIKIKVLFMRDHLLHTTKRPLLCCEYDVTVLSTQLDPVLYMVLGHF